MDTSELNMSLEDYEPLRKQAVGVFPADQLPEITEFPGSFIANTDESTKDGQHWVAFYVVDGKNVEYFDSYGLKPKNKHFVNYLKKFKKKSYNTKRLQGPLSTTCGQYALTFIFQRSLGISMKEFVEIFSKHDFHENDHLVQNMVEYYFDFVKPIYSVYSLNQICKALGH